MVCDVDLPAWAKTPEDFVRINRMVRMMLVVLTGRIILLDICSTQSIKLFIRPTYLNKKNPPIPQFEKNWKVMWCEMWREWNERWITSIRTWSWYEICSDSFLKPGNNPFPCICVSLVDTPTVPLTSLTSLKDKTEGTFARYCFTMWGRGLVTFGSIQGPFCLHVSVRAHFIPTAYQHVAHRSQWVSGEQSQKSWCDLQLGASTYLFSVTWSHQRRFAAFLPTNLKKKNAQITHWYMMNGTRLPLSATAARRVLIICK